MPNTPLPKPAAPTTLKPATPAAGAPPTPSVAIPVVKPPQAAPVPSLAANPPVVAARPPQQMPSTPSPKPSPVVAPAPPVATQPSFPGSTPSKPVSPQVGAPSRLPQSAPATSSPTKPPQVAQLSQVPIVKPGAGAPVGGGVSTKPPQASAATPSASAATAKQTPPNPSPQPPTALPQAPRQPQPAASSGTTQLVQKPTTPQPVRVQQPPQTLTALSSMASNKLPTGALKTTPEGSAEPTQDAAKNASAQPTAPNEPTLGPQKPQPEFVQPKQSVFRFMPFIAGGILLLLIVAFVFLRFFGTSRNSVSSTPTQNTGTTTTSGSNTSTGTNPGTTTTGTQTGKQVTLEYWGLWEPTEAMTEVIKGFETQNPGITIKYVKQSHKDYRTRLQSAINSGNGPDIYRFHASWVPMLKQELSPLPSAVMSASEYQSTYYPVAVQQLQNNGQLVGIPLMYDGLVLYYNTDIFKTAVVDPPKTWPDLRTLASKLTVKADGKLTRSGIALGNATNVEHFADILAVLILQNGGDLTKPNSAEVRDALLFYTNFIKTDAVWNDTLPSSTVAFARGEAAMMFAPSWRAHEVKAINPNIQFATVPLPQLSDKRITWGTYWAEGVSAKSDNKDESWKFIKYLSSKEAQQKMFAEQAKTRSFGELYARKDLADTLAKDPVVASVLQDAGYAQGWHMSTFTHDNGINDQIIQYYKDAVTGLVEGKSIEEVLVTLDAGVSQVLRQYGVTQGTGQAR